MRVPVLVADHEPVSLAALTEVLARRGFDVVATQDGGDALARFFEREPALIVAHQALPVLGGAQLCEQVKSQPIAARSSSRSASGSLLTTTTRARSSCDLTCSHS
ncbi:MAG: response regulator, partial [Myxococcota bacterium]